MKILIVDDSKTMHMIIKRALRTAGFDDHPTVFASSGEEALAMIRKEPPGLVLSDWNMPGMSGLDLLKTVKAEDVDLKFGFVTTEATPDMIAIAMEAGSDFMVAKPFTPENFEQTLGPLLDESEPSRGGCG